MQILVRSYKLEKSNIGGDLMKRGVFFFENTWDRLLGLSLLAYISLGLYHLAVIPFEVAQILYS